ncbi:MAG: DUF6798 domain-containing protein [Blastocatellia bacterium]
MEISISHTTAMIEPGARRYVAAALIVVVAFLCVSFNGGISIGDSNHAGLLPVVRRILDPNYLPGDFNIELRLYHHRVFAYLIAGLSMILGEMNAVILLHICGALLLAFALWHLCETLGLTLPAYLTAGVFLATGFLWTGLGLEENDFVGNAEIQPPLFAHSFILLLTAFLMRARWRAAAFFAGLATLFHLQIGATCALMIAPLYVMRLRQFGVKEILRLAALFLVPALPALIHLSGMLGRGLLRSGASEYSLPFYIDFRHPHHFALMSTAHLLWVSGHVVMVLVTWLWLRNMRRDEAPRLFVLVVMSLALVVLSAIHFADYYLLRQDKIANIQMIRLSPLLTVFGTLSVLLVLHVWLNAWQWGEVAPLSLLLIFATAWGVHTARDPESPFHLGLRPYARYDHAWVRMCNWIATNGPRDTAYVTPPGFDGFTYLTHRSCVAEFKINPDGGLHMAEWFERLRDLGGGKLPNEKGLKNRKPLNVALGKLSADQLIAASRKYHAGYAVLPQASTVPFEVLHDTGSLKLVRIPAP